ncbi:MAG: AAA domain-containing protein, partial [Nitrospiraceae bacterium]
VPSGLQQVTDQLAALKTDLNAIGRLLSRHDLDRMPIDEMTRFFQALAADRTTPYRIPRLLAIERAIQHHGAADIIQELRASKPEPELWVGVLERAWLHSCLDRARAEDPALGGFNGRSHDQFVEEFCRLDRQQLKSAAARIRHEHADHAMAILNRHEDQHLLVRREIEKRSGLLPLKQLLALAPEVLQALRPCWVASPLSVSQLIGTDRRYFDVVIVDEGSQLSPEVIVPSLLRAQQVVVAGDPHQLPPPLFSVTGKDEEPRQAARRLIERRESVLDHFSSFLKPWTLDCHYRSKDEALIAFSNRHLYGDRLTTFPMPSRSPCISHVLVRSGSEANGQEAGASREAQQVANLVIDHATAEMSKQAGERETLGVITLGLVHVRRIEAALEEALASRPDLGTFFDHGGLEPVFIKSVEDAQGDERDAIIFSLGFGKDQLRKSSPAGCSLLSPDGERRLNVAITRARRRMTIVSSFTHVDINDGAYRGRGKELLRRYLEYAACQGQRSVDDRQSNLSLSPLEQDIYDALTAKGIPLVHHWGRCRHRVSLAAIHPAHLERCVLAIECDGPSYLGARTARDRDRLRQQQLEALGWQFHRIWSIDWFMRRDEEIARVLRAFEVAVALADRRRHPADGQRLALTQPHENLVDPLHAIELTGDHTGPSSPTPESSDPHRRTRLANLLQ